MAEREHDLILLGATGFTGGLTAEYLATHAPAGLRWALAGRNPDKLAAVRERLTGLEGAPPAVAELALLHTDVTDAESLRTLAASTRAIVTTVGPYIVHGEPVVAACAAAGTDYLDITGEPDFVDRMWLGYHEQAQRSGARLIHACGFDSIPHDLGAMFTVGHLPEGVPLTVEGFVRAGGTFSGGTYQSVLHGMSHLSDSRRVAGERRRREVRPAGREVRGIGGRDGWVRYDDTAGGWALPLPTIDPQIVLRSAAALPRYGPSFRYGHYLSARRAATIGGIMAGAGVLAGLAQIGPARRQLEKLRVSGDGPTAEQRANAWFTVRFHGRPTDDPQAGVICEVAGGDPGYGETAKMLSQAALCLLSDDLPETAGQVTTAAALGQPLIDRLIAQGIGFRVLTGGARRSGSTGSSAD
jgi:short subunit dehydrogenase-like uncharacterized protein